MSASAAPSGIVSLLTDFGPGSVYVGQVHAVLARLAPRVRVIDLAHDLPFAGIDAASYVLDRSFRHFPPGTVHVVVVDPGVGSERAVLAARASGHWFVGPDNGCLAAVLEGDPDAEIRRLENAALWNDVVSRTFHGRDVLAPVAARLAGGLALAEVGPRTTATPLPRELHVGLDGVDGKVIMVDRFGNLITNIARQDVERYGDGDDIRIRLGASFIDGLVGTFTDVPRGMALAYIGSGDHLEIAVRAGRATNVLRLFPGSSVRVERRVR